MAAGQAVNPATVGNAAGQSVPVTANLAVPEPTAAPLSDTELDEIQGEWAWAVVGAIVGAYKAVKSCDNCSLAGKVAAGVTGAAVGATAGAFAAAGAMVSEAAAVVMGTAAGIAGYHAVKTSVDNIKRATGK